MVNRLATDWRLQACLVALALSFGCSSGSKPTSGVTEDPIPTPITLVSIPVLSTSPPDRWIVSVGQQVQFHAIDPTTGQPVDDKVSWNVYPYGASSAGSINQSGKYVAPLTPGGVVLSVGSPAGTPLTYMGGKYMDIVAAPPITLTLVSIPVLNTSPQDRWIVRVGQQVQFHAIDPTTGQRVDDKVSWNVYPHGSGDGFPGSIDQTGKYTAPSNPKSVVLIVRSPADTPLVYMGSKDMDIVAASYVAVPYIAGFTTKPLTITSGQSSSLLPLFENGQGQLLVGTQVIQASLASGTPVGVSPTATTAYTLQVTNAAGAQVRQDLTVLVR